MSLNGCVALGVNTGKGKCDVRMKRPKYVLNCDATFSASDLKSSSTLKAAIKRQMLLANGSSGKAYLSPLLRVVNDNTGDPNVQSLADGYEEVLNEATPKYAMQFTAGICQQQAWVALNGWTSGQFIIDQDNYFFYRTTDDKGGQGFTVGNQYTDPPRPGNSSNIAVGTTRITYGNVDEFKSNVGAIKLDFDPATLVNLLDVILKDVEDAFDSPSTGTHVFYIGAETKCYGDNIYASYKTALANTARWHFEDEAGNTLTVISVSAQDNLDSGNGGWIVAINQAQFNALASKTKIYANLADPTVLNNAGVTGIEGVALEFTKA